MTGIEKLQAQIDHLNKVNLALMQYIDKLQAQLDARITALEQLRQAQRDGQRARERVEAEQR